MESSASVLDTKRRKMNLEATLFDPEKQTTRYNGKSLSCKVPMVEITEKPNDTAEYHWLAKYDSVPSISPFNQFLNTFKSYLKIDTVREFQGIRYRYLRAGTDRKSNPVRCYRQFVIGSDFSIYRLGVNGSPNVDLGMNPRARERRFPLPMNKKFSIASLFWANELLNTQKKTW